MNIENKIATRSCEIKDTIPILKTSIDVLLKMEEVKTTPDNENAFNQSGRDYITKEVKQKVKEQILNDVNLTISKCKQYKVDILNVIKQFKKTKPHEFKKLVKFYGSEDAFFQACQFETKVIVRSIL